MDQGFRRGFTTAEKTELWDRWQRGESLKAIGRAFGKPSSSIYFHVLNSMPTRSDIERRNQAVIAFTLLSGARDNAIASNALKHVDLENRRIYREAGEVQECKGDHFGVFPCRRRHRAVVANWVQPLGERLTPPPRFP